jgi:hypothetical protein
MPNDATPAASDIDVADLDSVSGGLNPQPLPPNDGGGGDHSLNPVQIPR